MSELSYLEKLLDGVEVEWSNLGNLCDIFTGGEAPQKHIKGDTPTSDYQYPIYGNGAEIYGYADSYRIGQDAVTISSIGANTGTIYFRKAFFTPIIRLKVVIPKHSWLLPRYLFHYLSSQTINSKSSSVPNMNASDVKKLSIPIPCPNNPEKSLAIQSEIVRILDKFTALTAKLTAELNMRKKQYNYYRDQLLSFDNEDVPHLPMGQKDIGEFIRGGTFQKKDFMDAGVGCIHYGQIYTYYGTYTKKTKTHISAALAKKCKKAQKGNLIIATTSENDEDVCKAVAWLGSDDIAVSSDACIYKHNLNPKYVSYYFQTEQFQNQKRQYITGAKVRRVNADNLSKILIPVPSMAVQERIVSILDKFDTLTNSITEGLPREIELRQKQYEYYRDLLFSFPKPETASN
ncbi:type-1 restriction enzyme specificity protein [Enterobacter asburiae]|uniref:restriction endonuclease subunit S n=1 Tax=Enterobacter asburiae TaxID=61645 RepID=UPI000799B4C8|nr:restriction endonuclease subunit S [Enterobacter asburiae]SAI02369.1 type-1 restriction enzyme specificity protein [Enterobacter asburiae]